MEEYMKNNFAVLLARRKLKVTDVSKATGISRTTLTSLYYEKNKAVSFEVLNKICDYLQCSKGEFFEEKEENKAELGNIIYSLKQIQTTIAMIQDVLLKGNEVEVLDNLVQMLNMINNMLLKQIVSLKDYKNS